MTFLFLTLFAIFIQGLFALFEMAAVSFNKIRLQYYVTLGKKRAIWLNYLLRRPSRLFGATLIGVNTALQVGSECSRQFYESLHLDPDLAPLSQILLVVCLAELAPLFAARRYPEQIALFLSPFMIAVAKLLSPIIWAFDALSRLVHKLMGASKTLPLFLSREEVKMAFEEKDEDELNQTLSNIFQLKSLTASELMSPLSHLLPSSALVSDVRSHLSQHYTPFIALYHRTTSNIVSIVMPRDLLRLQETRRALEHGRSPWFVSQETSVLQILDQFRRNNQSVAVILAETGGAVGLLTLDDILAEIFGEEKQGVRTNPEPLIHIERTLEGGMLVKDFNHQFSAQISYEEGETLSDLIARHLEHLPATGESVEIEPFLFTVLESTLLGAKTLSVETE